MQRARLEVKPPVYYSELRPKPSCSCGFQPPTLCNSASFERRMRYIIQDPRTPEKLIPHNLGRQCRKNCPRKTLHLAGHSGSAGSARARSRGRGPPRRSRSRPRSTQGPLAPLGPLRRRFVPSSLKILVSLVLSSLLYRMVPFENKLAIINSLTQTGRLRVHRYVAIRSSPSLWWVINVIQKSRILS